MYNLGYVREIRDNDYANNNRSIVDNHVEKVITFRKEISDISENDRNIKIQIVFVDNIQAAIENFDITIVKNKYSPDIEFPGFEIYDKKSLKNKQIIYNEINLYKIYMLWKKLHQQLTRTQSSGNKKKKNLIILNNIILLEQVKRNYQKNYNRVQKYINRGFKLIKLLPKNLDEFHLYFLSS